MPKAGKEVKTINFNYFKNGELIQNPCVVLNPYYLHDILLNKHVKIFSPTWNTETFVRKAKETAGILLGRTTIESWMCGKKSWIYNVDKSGGILSKELVSPPQDINKFYGSTVCEKLVDSYLNIINETSN